VEIHAELRRIEYSPQSLLLLEASLLMGCDGRIQPIPAQNYIRWRRMHAYNNKTYASGQARQGPDVGQGTLIVLIRIGWGKTNIFPFSDFLFSDFFV
jgi:hypothetical protein